MESIDHTREAWQIGSDFSSLETAQTDRSQVQDLGEDND
jgi:hypothetical protein